MSPILNSQGAVVATAMVVSGTVIVLALRLQKLLQTPESSQLPRSCLCLDGKRKEKKTTKKVKFAKDVRDPIGNSEEFRRRKCYNGRKQRVCRREEVGAMPANRLALYSGILRDRPVHSRLTSCH